MLSTVQLCLPVKCYRPKYNVIWTVLRLVSCLTLLSRHFWSMIVCFQHLKRNWQIPNGANLLSTVLSNHLGKSWVFIIKKPVPSASTAWLRASNELHWESALGSSSVISTGQSNKIRGKNNVCHQPNSRNSETLHFFLGPNPQHLHPYSVINKINDWQMFDAMMRSVVCSLNN